ncbi:MAG: M3 family oligoendopeptidase [Lewinella sp.]|nr:M3 family oligoendopeptidase [Lewinella sp.]
MTLPITNTDFSAFEYVRPDLEKLELDFRIALKYFEAAASPAEAEAQHRIMDSIRAEVATAANLAHIRYTINTKDPFYNQERIWGDEHYPAVEGWKQIFTERCLLALGEANLKPKLANKFSELLSSAWQLLTLAFCRCYRKKTA